jgi:hypothetical protein
VRLTPQFLRALSRLGGRAFYKTIELQTFYEFITFRFLKNIQGSTAPKSKFERKNKSQE